MQVAKYTHLTEEIIEKFTDVLTKGFKHNEFIYAYLMGESVEDMRKFANLFVTYNNHFADYYALIKDDGEWVAAAIYLPVGCEPLGIRSSIKRGKIFSLINLMLGLSTKNRNRLLKFSDLESKNWYKEPFVTLDVLTSLEKGCGKTLIEATMPHYNGQNIALNCSIDHNGYSYYKQFGFEAYKEILSDNYKTVMMVRKA